jgi:hypothetical protein
MMLDPKTLTPESLYRLQSETWSQGAEFERERIIKLLEDKDLQRHLYFWLEYGEYDEQGSEHKKAAIELIKGEQK